MATPKAVGGSDNDWQVLDMDTLSAKVEERREEFEKKALKGKATWGQWRYNPESMSLEIAPIIGGRKQKWVYGVDLEQCNSSAAIVGWLCQLTQKRWCTPEQVGYLFRAIYDLMGGPAARTALQSGKKFEARKRLTGLGEVDKKEFLKVREVANILRLSRASVYRLIKDEKLGAVKLPLGRDGELRIHRKQIDRMVGLGEAKVVEE